MTDKVSSLWESSVCGLWKRSTVTFDYDLNYMKREANIDPAQRAKAVVKSTCRREASKSLFERPVYYMVCVFKHALIIQQEQLIA